MKQTIWKSLSAPEQQNLLKRPAHKNRAGINDTVRTIIQNVRTHGDQAVKDYTKRFDKASLASLTVPVSEISDSQNTITKKARDAIDRAYNNIHTFHEKQGLLPYKMETMPGVTCARHIDPIERVGLYVPGGSAPLISTTLMLGVPAQIAKCPEKILCTPCNKEGVINPHILYAAQICGINKIFRIGGAQAIAAMAYGTESIPKTYKIFGPGNAYVTAAKIQASQDPEGAAIDMPAGPSEICVITNKTTNPAFAAADLLSQAEHDPLSQVILIATSPEQAQLVQKQLEKQLSTLPRKEIAKAALQNSLAIIAQNLEEAINIANHYAPEHLILCFEGAEKYLSQIKNAGSVFLGSWTPESAGDYASGTNHVLPTYGYARAYSGLGVEAFQRSMTVQHLTQEGLENLGPDIETLAELEGLDAHKNAVSLRIKGGT